jgi:gluconate 5-dehydrogenase
MPDFRLDGQRALVTGGNRGIGLGLARGLAEAGANLVLSARNADDLAAAQRELAPLGVDVQIAPFDVAQIAQIAGFYHDIVTRFGPIDILINNAGGTRRGPAHELSLDDWQTVLDLNLTSVFELSRCFAKERIAAARPGRIINVGSLMCNSARAGTSPYAATKGGILLLTKALAMDWAPYGILVNAIGPGYIETPLTAPLKAKPEFDAWVTQTCPLSRWGTPADLAGAVTFLASPAASYITGQIIYIDGGWLAKI